MGNKKKKILIIHTGGTFVMESNEQGQLKPGDYAYDHIDHTIRTLFDEKIVQTRLLNIDSSLFRPCHWIEIAEHINKNYHDFDSFVIIHGTDTMAYSAAALSFMLKNLGKPVVMTGSQLPLKNRRSDALMNLIDAIEVALFSELNEVVVIFNHTVFRGNRVKKKDSWDFDAFYSPNYNSIVKLGIGMEKKLHRYLPKSSEPFEIDTRIVEEVIIIPFFPGIDFSTFSVMVKNKKVKGIVIEAYGSGNVPSDNPGLEELFKEAAENSVPIAVCSQSPIGKVNLGLYEVASKAEYYGLISAVDMTREATLVKLMVALGRYKTIEEIKKFMTENITGEKESDDVR
ncbi:MAG: asparaginase [bacterium]